MSYWVRLVSSCIFNCSPKFFNVFMVCSIKLTMFIISIFCCWSPLLLKAVSAFFESDDCFFNSLNEGLLFVYY